MRHFFASDTIIGIKKEKTNTNNTIKPVKTTQNNGNVLTFYDR